MPDSARPPHSGNLARVARKDYAEAAMAFGLRGLGACFNVLFFVLLARSLGAAGIGEFTLFLALSLALSILSRLGLDNVIVKRASVFNMRKDYGALKDLYHKAITTSLGSSMAIYLLFQAADTLFGPLHVPHAKHVFWLALFLSVLLLQAEFLRGIRRTMLSYALSFMLPPAFCCAYSFLCGLESVNEVFTIYIALMACMVLAAHCCIANLVPLARRDGKANSYTGLVRSGLPMIMATSMDIALYWVSVLTISTCMNTSDLGVFGVVYRACSVMIFVVSAVNSISRVRFSEQIHRKNTAALKRDITQTNITLLAGCLPIFLVLFLFPDPILSLFGENFLHSSGLLRILSLGILLYCATAAYPCLIAMFGYGTVLTRAIILSVTVTVSLSAVMIPPYGLNGVVLALVAGMCMQNLKCYWKWRQIRAAC